MSIDDQIAYKAQIMLHEIEMALARGTKHYAVNGRPLNTVMAIIEALLADGAIQFQPDEIGRCRLTRGDR